MKTNEKLELLEPSEDTIISYKEIETQSIDRLKEFLEGVNGDKYNKTAIKILQSVNKIRSTLKSQISIKAQIFKDISVNKKEFKQYINISFPKMLRK